MSISCDPPLAHRWLSPPSTVQEGGGGARTQGTGYRWHRGHRQADCMARGGEGNVCVYVCVWGRQYPGILSITLNPPSQKGISLSIPRYRVQSVSSASFSTACTFHSLSLSHVTSSHCRICFRCHALFDIQQRLIPICSLISTDTPFIITHTFDCFIRIQGCSIK